jgi:uncharacterized protein (DUF427 family)
VSVQPSEQPVAHEPPSAEHRIEVEPSPRWVRVYFGGEAIADSKRVLLLREGPYPPVYYFHPDDVRQDLLVPSELTTECPFKGTASYWSVRVGDRVAEDAVWGYRDPLPARRDIAGYLSFYWDRMDAWFEEAEEIFVHARDPHKRVDVVASSRHVRVELNGVTLAESKRPYLVFETGLPTRYYLPQDDVRLELLTPTATSTRCPYKGIASYWSVNLDGTVADDIVWSYPDPIPEAPKLANLLCFYNEHVDLYVDGELQPRPQTPWS